jgi:hypothetical protein
MIPSQNDEFSSKKVCLNELHFFGPKKEVNHFFLSGFFSQSAKF